MKIALINDTHWGVKSASPIFLDYFRKFYDKVFFPALKERGVTTLIHGGDLVDSRKFINYLAADSLHKTFLDPILNMGIDAHFIMGNHDQFHSRTIKPNSLDVLFHSENVKYPFNLYETATEVVFDNLKMLLVPWICEENRNDTYNLIKATDAQVVYGHLELAGFEFYKGIVSQHGESANVYKKFDRVFSGHYHTKSRNSNIEYLGAPYEFTWADYNDPRGFHIFDTESRELEFIENPFKMYAIVDYDEDQEIDLKAYEGMILKVNPKNKQSQSKFDEFVAELDNAGTCDYTIIPEASKIVLFDSIENIELESTLSIITHYIDELDDPIDKIGMKTLMGDLFTNAMNQMGKF